MSRFQRTYLFEEPRCLPGEIWKPVPNFENFSVSSFGRIRNRIGIIKPAGREYRYVTLRNGNLHRTAIVATFMLLAFVGPPPDGQTIARHLNDKPSDDNLSNLAWGSKADNTRDAIRNGRLTLEKLERAWAARRAAKGIPTGQIPWNKGKTLTEQHRTNISLAKMGR
jgi:hypothetical protein